MKLGIVVRADRSGLGYQTKALYDMLKPKKILVIDSTFFNRREQNYKWYEGAKMTISDGFPNNTHIEEFLKGLDVVITCEIPYNYRLYSRAKELGIKTVCQPNPEFNEHFRNTNLPLPDAFFIPSRWYENETRGLGVKTYFCPPPIDMKPVPKTNTKARGVVNVLHIAGRKAQHDRNGTEIVLKTMRGMRGVNLTVLDQGAQDIKEQEDMYKGDYHVMLLPRRYGGLCLPVLESLGHGLPVIMPNISPNNQLLPEDWLVPAHVDGNFRAKINVELFNVNVAYLRNRLIQFRQMDDDSYQVQRNRALEIYNDYQSNLGDWKKFLQEVVDE